jgi:hypothetical protein
MQVTLRFSRDDRADFAAVLDRLMGCVLLQSELATARMVIGGFYFDTERSPMLFLADLEQEGFHFDDFDSIKFEH